MHLLFLITLPPTLNSELLLSQYNQIGMMLSALALKVRKGMRMRMVMKDKGGEDPDHVEEEDVGR